MIRGLGSPFFCLILVRIRIFCRLIWMFSFLSDALDRTDTRDSITEILQYSARLTAGIVPSSQVPTMRVYKSLSGGRKIFRLFRFVPEMKLLAEMDVDETFITKLNISTTALSAAFYLLDNSIYYLETVKRKSRSDIRPVKFVKNRLALLRTVLGMLLTVLEMHRIRKMTTSKSIPNHMWVRLWHDMLRLWLTMHKLHLLSLFLGQNIVIEKSAIISDSKYHVHVIPGVVGLASAITSLIRRTVLRNSREGD